MSILSTLAALIYGGSYTTAWIIEDNKEQQRRENMKNKGVPFYYDKQGIIRHTSNGKKYTVQEVHEQFFSQNNTSKKRFEKKYWGVINPFKWKTTMEVFLTYEEAKEYIEECKNSNETIMEVKEDPVNISQAYYECKNSNITFVLHF